MPRLTVCRTATREVDHTLAHTHKLLASYQRLLAGPSPSTSGNRRTLLSEARDELLSSLDVLEGDIVDLEDAVEALEAGQRGGGGWGLGMEEVRRRRGELEGVKREVAVGSGP